VYDESDTDFKGAVVHQSLIDENGGIVLSSDSYYHVNIDEQIRGFLVCLDYLGIAHERREQKRNSRLHDTK
jgi:hypothetical protein